MIIGLGNCKKNILSYLSELSIWHTFSATKAGLSPSLNLRMQRNPFFFRFIIHHNRLSVPEYK